MATDAYYVIGGVFDSTDWQHVMPETAEVLGPFPYAQAMEHWRERTFQSIDNAHARYLLVEADKRRQCCESLGIAASGSGAKAG